MARKLFADILRDVQNAPTDADKIDVLRTNNTTMLRQLLIAAFDPKVVFDVDIPSYRENDETDGFSANSIYVEYRRLYVFLESYKVIPRKRKTELLAQILESIDRSDAIALIDVINKDLGKYELTVAHINAAFPGLIK